MVIVKIWGGLGNQLFQYSFGKYLAAKLDTTVKYEVQTTNNLRNFTQRDFVLSSFNVTPGIATAAEINKMRYFSNVHLARIERKLAQQLSFLFKRHFVEQNVPALPGAVQLRDNCYYEGYWQSYEYLLPNELQLRQELVLKVPLSPGAERMLKDLRSSVSAGVHVRRGDYVSHAHLINCSLQYYQNAMAHLKRLNAGIKFFIFSDDVDWCKQHFTGSDCVFAEGNTNYEDLWLMSRCNHQIIANSTFSWWAAWLNEHPAKTIIAPGSWHAKKDKADSRLLPAEWIKMDA